MANIRRIHVILNMDYEEERRAYDYFERAGLVYEDDNSPDRRIPQRRLVVDSLLMHREQRVPSSSNEGKLLATIAAGVERIKSMLASGSFAIQHEKQEALDELDMLSGILDGSTRHVASDEDFEEFEDFDE